MHKSYLTMDHKSRLFLLVIFFTTIMTRQIACADGVLVPLVSNVVTNSASNHNFTDISTPWGKFSLEDKNYSSSSQDVSIGDDDFYGLTVSIMFDIDPHHSSRPRIPSTSEYVAIGWGQHATTIPLILIMDRKDHKSIHPYWAGSDSTGYHQEEYAVPRNELIKPCFLVVVVAQKKPTMIPLQSLALADYQNTMNEEDFSKSIIGPDPDHQKQIHRLRELDPLIMGRSRNLLSSFPVAPPIIPAPPTPYVQPTAPTPTEPPSLQHRSIQSPSGAVFDFEVADTAEAQERGLSGRYELDEQHGMAFVVPTDRALNLWMKNVPFSLDFIFVRRDGRITSIVTLRGSPMGALDSDIPRTTGYGSIVLAVPRGSAQFSGFRAGSIIPHIIEKFR